MFSISFLGRKKFRNHWIQMLRALCQRVISTIIIELIWLCDFCILSLFNRSFWGNTLHYKLVTMWMFVVVVASVFTNGLVLAARAKFKNGSRMVTPLHLSYHFFIRFNVRPRWTTLCLPIYGLVPPQSPTNFSSLVFSALPPFTTFSSLVVNDVTESLCSTLSSCLDSLCPLSTRTAWATQSYPWLSDTPQTLHACWILSHPTSFKPYHLSSYRQSHMWSAFKVALVTARLKKPSLNPTHVENYWPVSFLKLL